jgi:hypothetical protein
MALTIDGATDNVGDKTGEIAYGGATNDTTPTLSGTTTAGASVAISIEGGPTLGTTIADQEGNWSFTPLFPQADGSYTFVATVQNAGKPETDSFKLTIDTTPGAVPVIASVTDDVGLVQGALVSGQRIDDTTPMLQGSGAVSGDTIRVYDNDKLLGSTTVRIDGTWLYTPLSTLLEGAHALAATSVDAAGNESTKSAAVTVIVDTTAPTAVATISAIATDTGRSANDMVTSDRTLLISATVAGAISADERVQISLDSGLSWQDAARQGANWVLDATGTPLPDGSYTFVARVIDEAGNTGFTTTHTVVIDATAPASTVAITSYTDNAQPRMGDFASGTTTNDDTPLLHGTITGALGADESVAIYRNGVYLGDAAVAGSTWTFQDAGLIDGTTYDYTAVVQDIAGNQGDFSNDFLLSYRYEIPPPSFTGFNYWITQASDDGLNTTDNKTSVATPTFTGTITGLSADGIAEARNGELMATVTLTDTKTGAQVVAEALVSYNLATGKASFTVTSPSLVSGDSYTLSASLHVAGSTWLSDPGLSQYVYNGTTTPVSGSLLQITQNVAGETYTGTVKNGGLGYSMSAIGDYNGDGYTDYIVSAPHDTYGLNTTGGLSTMYLLYGNAYGLPNLGNLSTLTAAQGIVITSTSKTDAGVQGLTVTGIGDFNGDGLDDVAISSNYNDTAYVLYGQKNNTQQTINLAATNVQGFTVTTDGNRHYMGQSITGADVNSDGYSDLIIGSPDDDGSVMVIYGHAGGQGTITLRGDEEHTVASGASRYTNIYAKDGSDIGLGTNMQAVGDVNGDGYTDYVVTAPGEAGGDIRSSSIFSWLGDALFGASGKYTSAYVVFGGTNAPMGVNVSLESMVKNGQAITLTTTNNYEALGGSAANAGGSTGIDATGASVTAQTALAQYAQYHSVASLGNIDGSGSNFFAIGSPGVIGGYSNGGISDGAGAVYVFGSQSNWSAVNLPTWNSGTQSWSNLASLTKADGFVIYSSSFAAFATSTASSKFQLAGASDLGFSLSSAGDVNGDGVTDFLIGAPLAYQGTGAVFLVFGSAGGLLGQSSGVVDLDKITVNLPGSTTYSATFGTAGTAWIYTGTSALSASYAVSSYLGTDVTGGDFSGTGISGYSFSAWNATNSANGSGSAAYAAGQTYIYNGTTAYLTQSYSNGDDHVYYAGDQGANSATIRNGVDLIATGTGNNDWVHGIGADTLSRNGDTTVQHDAVSGGIGNDYVGILSTNFTSVNGGAGWNTLVFEGSNITLDLADMGLRVQGFAAFDLSNQLNNANTDSRGLFTDATVGNTLQLGLADVLSESNDTVGLNTQRMTVLGDSASTVEFTDKGWTTSGTQTISGTTYDVWHNSAMGGSTYADLLVQKGVHVTASPSITGTSGHDYLYGTNQADTLDGGTGVDVLMGYGGNDLLKTASDNFALMDGGSGFDVLQLTGAGLNLNFANIKGIEQIYMGASAGNTLNVSLQDVLRIPDATPKTLTINGDTTDTVKLSAADGFVHGAGDVQFQNGVAYEVWHAGSGLDVATLLLQQALHVQQV